ncbi:MAG: alpha/beta hydrolase [Acidobacteria bacterium]|nr:alpha/beta hydrolase [Acidobacteriota bacterium]
MRRAAPPGRLVDAGGFRLHLHTSGQGGPSVVFDAALGATSLSWALVQPGASSFARTCVYDRAGFGWSEPGPLPRTAGRAADELRRALDHAGEPPPYLLVGHSYGGLVMRTFAGRYRADTAGLILVDPAHPEDWLAPAPKEQARIDRGVRLCRQAQQASRAGLAHLVSALIGIGAVTAARSVVNTITRHRFEPDLDFILAPFFKLPRDVQAPVRRFWTRPAFFESLGSQIGSMSTSAREVLDAGSGGYGDLPLVTISRADLDDHTLRRQQAVAGLSSRGRHVVARRGGHWIPLDDPDLIVDVIRDMHVELRRSGL